jgi:hypothetical protein
MIGLLVEEAWPSSCGDNWLRQIQVRPVIGEPIKHRWDLFNPGHYEGGMKGMVVYASLTDPQVPGGE